MPELGTALLIVDVQHDFLPPNGSLGVENGRDILPHILNLLEERWQWAAVVASQDYHPPGHISFASSHEGRKPFETIQVKNKQGEEIDQILWPDHCVQGTKGCEIEQSLAGALDTWKARSRYHLVQKGTDKDLDAYSAFASPSHASASSAPTHASSPLTQYLRSQAIENIVICGIATDVCVKATVEDALSEGFKVTVIEEACKGVSPKDAKQALTEMQGKGAKIVSTVQALESNQ